LQQNSQEYWPVFGGEVMRLSKIAGIAAAALLSVAPSALAQTPTQSSETQTPALQTFTGCLMTERDYRRAHNLGDGTLGGVGLGDEFVLVDVKVSAAKGTAATAPVSDAPVASPVAASASASTCADKGVAYRVMGSDEEKLKNFVGRHLEIQGRFKHAADAAAGGTRPDEKLPAEVEIVSFSEAPAPAVVTEPAAAATSPPTATTPPPAAQTAPPPAAQTAPPPAAVVETPRSPITVPVTPPATDPATPRRELPRTAGSSDLLVLIGVLALSSGVALMALRRRAL
jgi:LPXTG-motif cell wall-anchored protein